MNHRTRSKAGELSFLWRAVIRSRYPGTVMSGLLFFFLVGCALHSKDISYHNFDYPVPPKLSASPIPETLMVYRFLLDRSIPIDNLVITQSSGQDQTMFLYRWEENPADMLTALVLRDLQNSGLFERVVDQLSTVRYRYALEATTKKLQGTVLDGKAGAVLDMDTMLTDFEAPLGRDKTIFKKNFHIEIPSSGPDAESIIKALNAAVKEFSERLRQEIISHLRSGELKEKSLAAKNSKVSLVQSNCRLDPETFVRIYNKKL